MTAQETECRRQFEKWNASIDDHDNFRDALWSAYQAAWNTIGKEMADALEAAYKLIEVDYREADESTGEYIEKRARTTWENICAALTKYRGTKCVILES